MAKNCSPNFSVALMGTIGCLVLAGCLDPKLVADITLYEATDSQSGATSEPSCQEKPCEALGNLSTEDQLASFYGCTSIDGDLSFVGYEGEDLSSLSCLGSVSGNLIITAARYLKDLQGLHGLEAVGGNLVIGDPLIGGNDRLEGLEGLSRLTRIGGDFILGGNRSLDELEGLESLVEVGGSFTIDGNPALEMISSFDALARIGGDITIKRNSSLRQFLEVPKLEKADGTILIYDNPVLEKMPLFPNLSEVRADFVVRKNPQLGNLDGLEALKRVGGAFIIADNHGLNSLAGLDGLTYIGGTLVLGSSQLGGNRSLAKVNGLEKLETVGGSLVINTNIGLMSLEGLVSLAYVGGSMQICGNYKLPTLDGLESLAEVAGDLNVGCYDVISHGLENIDGLSGIKRVGGMFSVENNTKLQSLDGMYSLKQAQRIFIQFNPSLLTVRGLRHLRRFGLVNVVIYLNESLPACDPLKLRDLLFAQGFHPGGFSASFNLGKGECTDWPNF